ncbi:nucleophile aminohydrolase [Pelagophyceae sp. CCMP2097]|nr:nucleophile aminohydrolase [Pelagophyceae sp. CCMP2097]
MDYGYSLTTFSRSGKLLQIEYALTAVGEGKTSLGIKARNGVVLCTDKKLPSKLVDSADVRKLEKITPSCGFVYSGIGPDYRVLVKRARKEAQGYFLTYNELKPIRAVVQDTAAVMQEYTQSGGVRPFGVSCLVAGYDDEGPQLFQVDPSGAFYGWKASAIGKNHKNARSFLEKRYSDEMELDDAIHTALLTMREGFEGEMNEHNIELAVVGEDRVFRNLTPAEIKDYLDEAN